MDREVWVWSDRSPCGWVPCKWFRTIERGRRQGFYEVRFGNRGRPGRWNGRTRKQAIVDPKLVKECDHRESS